MDERLLLRQIASGNERAFRIIFDRYRATIYTYVLKIIKSEQKAEEILHDTFLKLWQQQNTTEIDNVEAYLRVVARNATLKALRKSALDAKMALAVQTDAASAYSESEETFIGKEAEQILAQGISLLPPQQKLVYELCRFNGLKYNQVAEKLSISPLTVKTHMQHALRFLRQYYLDKQISIILVLYLLS